ncbi:ATP-binding protein [Stigmatella aurantiaca]|uniref:histidine kinase n=1 Tax=Stigmatella aurantiaca (strain DW4/3-1) TaxID=378806 RepID=Q092A9_STIAD|nr:ATP-binding protein [Stigmatella aurantiaca]ADO75724.1 RedE protein [Stigmatella aurantiaca DW4/3-1]EAU66556.1 RedE [Stigmatella aurantiaca DW4/3-1]
MDENTQGLPVHERAVVAEVVTAVLRHNLRNRFSSIRNASYYLMRQAQKTELWKGDPRVQAFFQLIDRELASAEELLSHRGPPALAGLQGRSLLREAVDRAFARVRVPGTLRWERSCEDQTPLEADAEDLTLLTRCLLENALEAMPEGGQLTVRTLEQDAQVILEVSDTGPGIPPEQQAQVFEPFMTTKPGHVGVGLCIVQRLALRSRAWVELRPREPRGTQVRVYFPLGEP